MKRLLLARWDWVEARAGLLLLPLLWPALRTFFSEGLTRSFDSGLHLLRIGMLDRHLRAGVLFPRWTPEALLGYGYPLFNFYAPASYYVAEALHLLGFSEYYAFIIAMACFLVAGAAGMFALCLEVYGPGQRLPAMAAAIAYAYAPYLLTNIYIRGALAEVAAQALLPWILFFGRRLFYVSRPERMYLPFALLLGLLALTHNITLLFLPPLLLAYLFLHWWLSGRSRHRLLWPVLGVVTAMGVSAFFWFPLVAERRYLAESAYEISVNVWLPTAVWRWDNFLDRGLVYTHSFARPIRLGLVQLALALAGFLLARRRDAEWLFFAGTAILAVAMMGAWALPLWQNVGILAIAQFPWRLLSILTLPLSIFSGGILLAAPAGRPRVPVAAALIAVIILSHQPRLAWMDVYAPESVDVSAAVLAQTDVEKGTLGGGEGNSSIQEFRPKWADRTLILESDPVTTADSLDLTVQSGNNWEILLTTDAVQPATLRFADFHYPGWRVLLDDNERLNPYPSTNLGVRTVDIPSGRHTLAIEWVGTWEQRLAAVLSLATLAVAALLGWRARTRVLAILAALMFGIGIYGIATGPLQQVVQQPVDPIEAGSLKLVGVRTAGPADDRLIVYPYWFVSSRVEDGLRFRWTLADGAGEVVAETVQQAYYNSYGVENWPSSTLVDDAVMLRLRPDAASAPYELFVAAERARDGEVISQGKVGELELPAVAEAPAAPESTADAQFGDSVHLAGYDLLSPRRTPVAGRKTPVVQAGDYLRLRLYWQGVQPIVANYHSFVHMVDHLRRPLVQEDQLPGPIFQPPRLWDRLNLWPDVYLLRLPDTAESGLYWPAVGMYEFETEDRLPVEIGGADASADDVLLPPLKILGSQTGEADHPQNYALGDFAEFRGYSLEPTAQEIAAGSSLSVTLYFESRQVTERDLVRFLQLVGPSGVVAQSDSPPVGGHNPTWSWAPGERIVDLARLEIADDVPPGDYQLYAGLYDAADEGRRTPVFDGKGNPVEHDWIPLGTITVTDLAP